MSFLVVNTLGPENKRNAVNRSIKQTRFCCLWYKNGSSITESVHLRIITKSMGVAKDTENNKKIKQIKDRSGRVTFVPSRELNELFNCIELYADCPYQRDEKLYNYTKIA